MTMPESRRSTSEIRAAMAKRREQIENDLSEVQERIDSGFHPVRLLSRHPALTLVAGAVVGLFLVRNPAFVGRTLTRAASVGAPLLLKAIFQRSGPGPDQGS